MRVLLRDPRMSKAVPGRWAWRRPLPPATVVGVEAGGRKLSLRRDDGAVVKAHLEDVVELPAD
eukprot:13159232-Alexandrium_andersonii.AAC.1